MYGRDLIFLSPLPISAKIHVLGGVGFQEAPPGDLPCPSPRQLFTGNPESAALGNLIFNCSITILLISVLGHGLAVMAMLTQRLPVQFIPE